MHDDIEAIKQLKARYFRTMDTKDWPAMRQVFCDDVVMDSTASGGSVGNHWRIRTLVLTACGWI
ncbi:MAG: nuclear transport factor 2 family protein [Haliea sp.]|nr:nuclear transport factor 2 family protein [Haliea sp.]